MIKLVKINFQKLFLKTNINIKERSLTISKTSKKTSFIKYHIEYERNSYDILVLILNKKLLDLLTEGSSGGVANTIIGKKVNKINTISISEQKTLFGKIVVITPNIPKRTKIIINASKQTKKLKVEKIIKPLIQNKEKQKIIIKPKTEIKKEKPNTKQKIEKHKKTNKQLQIKAQVKNTNINNKPKYKLQKKNSKLVAIFSTFTASILFGIALAVITTKKLIHGLFVAPAFALLNHRKNKKTKTLVKKYQN